MKTGEGRLIGMCCGGCIRQFYYYPHPWCYDESCPYNVPVQYKPNGMGEQLKKEREELEKEVSEPEKPVTEEAPKKPVVTNDEAGKKEYLTKDYLKTLGFRYENDIESFFMEFKRGKNGPFSLLSLRPVGYKDRVWNVTYAVKSHEDSPYKSVISNIGIETLREFSILAELLHLNHILNKA